jgi:hypothetical protein
MQRIRAGISILICSLILSGCIKPYFPDFGTNNIEKYVVSGLVTSDSGYQLIHVSLTSPLHNQTPVPLAGCVVRVTDDSGQTFSASENRPGEYRAWMEKQDLSAGKSFKVTVITPNSDTLESDYDRMPECPPVDSVYYQRKDIPSNEPQNYTKGIQFYLDIDGKNTGSQFYKWDLTETWEYHSQYPIEWYYIGRVMHVYPPDYSKFVCWRTQPVNELFLLSIKNLTQNSYNSQPLMYLDNRSARLLFGYSLLIRQFAISEAAFAYWDELRSNGTDQGGLYEKQPLSVAGNMHNLTEPDKPVLGFFSAAGISTKRLFISKVDNLTMEYEIPCYPQELTDGFKRISYYNYPAYLMGDKSGYQMIWLNDECVDCEAAGGSITKPEFWPR